MKKLLLTLFFPLFVGGVVSLITLPFMDKMFVSFVDVPSFVFPLVWSVLYILMGVGACLVLIKGSIPISYFIQLGVNALWSIIFFVFDFKFLAVVWILILFCLVLWMVFDFYRVSKFAAFLQIPYLLWILFAGYLSLGIFLLN